jgi:FixJ family two-component response regulator
VPGVPIIAVVDDDVSVRAATDRFVRSLGLISRTFASAEDFLHSSCLHETSCVLADVHMPGMSGIDLQDHLLSLGHPVPIVFITAYPEVSVRARALNSGAVCFLSKPYDGPTMARCIDAALSRRNAGSSDN